MSLNSYVISLKNQSERRNHITKVFSDLNLTFHFYDAIDTSKIDEFIDKNSIKLRASHLSDGEIACYLSHFDLWQQAVDKNLEYIAIFEDDIYLAKDASTLLTELNWLPKNFDAIKLETMNERVSIHKTTKLVNNRYLAKMQSRHMGGAGYIVSRKGASKLINKTLTDGITGPVDHLIFDWLIHNGKQVYQVTPAICIQDKVFNASNSIFNSCLEEERSQRPKPPKPKGLQKLNREFKRLKTHLTTDDLMVDIYLKAKGYRKEVIEYEP